MKPQLGLRWLGLLVLALALYDPSPAWADGHKRKNKHRPAAAQNQTYAQTCGQCHMAYPPCLLPAASWRRLLEGRGDHFGESLSLSDAEAGEIKAFLEGNAADRAGGKRARKIMSGLGSSTPLRPSQTPYMLHKHDEVAEAVFARPSVGGRGNCRACHPGAEQGDFDDHRLSIPR